MELPDDAVGISDIIDWMECPRRFSFGMRRHTEDGEAPEAAAKPSSRYGSAIHDGFEILGRQPELEPDDVLQELTSRHRWMTPEDADQVRWDIETYRSRAPETMDTVMVEAELRVPLMIYEGRQIYFRGRIDRLYQSRTDPGHFEHRDYKSSKWPRSQSEVDADPQMWAYNWLLFEWMPEIETLGQTYDQLRAGEIRTSKNAAQRRQMRDWLRRQVTAILDDDEYAPDGLLVPSWNEWCAFCPIMESCAVVGHLSDYALAEIAALSGSSTDPEPSKLDPAIFDVYVEQLDKVSVAKQVLDRYEKTVKRRLREMPSTERERFGFTLRTRSVDVFSPQALQAAHAVLGDRFYEVASLTKTQLASALSGDPITKNLVEGMADRRTGAAFVQRVRRK